MSADKILTIFEELRGSNAPSHLVEVILHGIDGRYHPTM